MGGISEYQNIGILEYWNIAILECWNIGILEYWYLLFACPKRRQERCNYILKHGIASRSDWWNDGKCEKILLK
jgi:hypothetical protein